MGDLKSDFKQLVQMYEAEKAAAPTEAEGKLLLIELVDKLYQEAADHWYSSSADC